MQLIGTVQNEAILSNVESTGEFRIRNSAKAFNILSSGLYANKIKAIIRELSTNAKDSHVSAGCGTRPFEVHLPTALEPWFSIRDFGTGLNHDQVTNIYTTYFESTKTSSNDFVGCLGLGSKSPFAYTENFTVTAIKDGMKGVYSAFINEQGVPSIALMATSATEEEAGVEIRFAVENDRDFSKFANEAAEVYKWFSLKPIFTDGVERTFDVKFVDHDIIPGVHSWNGHTSLAIMGSIAYPIDVPNAEANLGELANLLYCGLVMHFEIGELDFQASREGLSYIPQTIEAIKQKLIAVNSVLVDRIAADANKIENLWERTFFLQKQGNSKLWNAAVTQYVVSTNFPLITANPGKWDHLNPSKMTFDVADLAKDYNIVIRGFSKWPRDISVSMFKPHSDRNHVGSQTVMTESWRIQADSNSIFVKNDGKTGALERAKYHWRNTKFTERVNVFVLDVADRSKPAKFDEFIKAIHNPPKVVFASTLLEKPRNTVRVTGQSFPILKLQRRDGGYRSSRSDDMVWREAGSSDKFDDQITYYYLPLSGYTLESTRGYIDTKDLYSYMVSCGIAAIAQREVYGVRKSDIKNIQAKKNWVNLEDHIEKVLRTSVTDPKIALGLAISKVDRSLITKYNLINVDKLDPKSPMVQMLAISKGITGVEYNSRALGRLINRYAKELSVEAITDSATKMFAAVNDRYPLIQRISEYTVTKSEITEYVAMIDQVKGV